MDERIQAQLQRGEPVLWTGQPSLRKFFGKMDWFIILLSIFGVVLMTGIAWKAYREVAPLLFYVFTAFCAIIVFYNLIGRYLLRRYNKQQTVYALTDRRMIICRGKKEVISVYLIPANRVQKDSDKSGIGDIIVGTLSRTQRRDRWTGMESLPWLSSGYPQTECGCVLYDIEDAHRVCGRIQNQMERIRVAQAAVPSYPYPGCPQPPYGPGGAQPGTGQKINRP